jgi:hypothetical protein
MSYPLRFPDDDPRFSNDLIAEIANVLYAHGYPTVIGNDTAFDGLRAALASFLYGPAFNPGDKVTWVCNDKVWNGKVEYVANGDSGPVARIDTDPQSGGLYRTTWVVPCRELTLVSGGA